MSNTKPTIRARVAKLWAADQSAVTLIALAGSMVTLLAAALVVFIA